MGTESKDKIRDVFAEIALQRQSSQEQNLVEPQPLELPEILLPVRKGYSSEVFKPQQKLNTAKKLDCELRRQRLRYSMYLRDLSPKSEATRIQLPLETFDWRIETEEDLKDFTCVLKGKGKWERITIPHYGAPLGRAVTYYRTTFKITKTMMKKGSIFICFKGVDYKAHIFINSAYIGSHEGFFGHFEFDFTSVVREGKNTLLVKVENDAICMGNDSWGDDGHKYEGDKIYAATGPGYDDPKIGWHCCPPGMGIYQDVFIDARAPVHVHDIFVRPVLEEARAEAWIEVYSCSKLRQDISLEFSVFGQNFRKTVFCNRKVAVDYAGPGVNYYRLSFDLPHPRIWEPDNPWLYQIQVKVLDKEKRILDAAVRQFGMRSFHMDETHEPKGRFYLNSRQIRLRGANTVGHLQQCVIKRNWDQLRDDILLAKICNMNFLRLTQRPVQPEIYDFCDRLGLMLQTDLPLFCVLRRNQFSEAVRQAGEMEKLIRSHSSSIMVTYINEPSPNAWGKSHRYLLRHELEALFTAADRVIHLNNPDRIIKAVDGDYDPPGPGLPDNHCYCGWYNGHGLDLGRLHKGYWQKVKPGWMYGCGEFGSEGLDPVKVMRKYYPRKWLPQSPDEEKSWTPDSIVKAQTGRFYYMWFETQHTLKDWVQNSLMHQAWVTRLMTEAFRRDNRMNSFAIYHFIDAFPAGWMKAIMDVERQPKPAYFAYREALTPLMANLRTDRYSFFSSEKISMEVWICNDLNYTPRKPSLRYQIEYADKIVCSGRAVANVPLCGSKFQGFLQFSAPVVSSRSKLIARLGLFDENNELLHDTSISLDVFPAPVITKKWKIRIVGSVSGKGKQLAEELGLTVRRSGSFHHDDIILIDDICVFLKMHKEITVAVSRGATAVFLELPEGKYRIAGSEVTITPCGRSRHFTARNTEHVLVKDFLPDDFKFWHNSQKGHMTPFLSTTFTAPGWNAILTSGNGTFKGDWQPALAAAEMKAGKGHFRVCQVNLSDFVRTNPVAMIFARRLLEY